MDRTSTSTSQQAFALITGLPRSGTTLAAALVDGLADVVALSEPAELLRLRDQSEDAAHFCMRAIKWHESMATKLSRGIPVDDIRDEGGNPVTDYAPRARCRQVNKPRGQALFTGQPHRLLLASKNNALYTSALPELVGSKRFRIFAIVRDPVALLQSWRTVPFPISRGTLPEGERFWRDLQRIDMGWRTALQKQINIIELFFARYKSLEPDLTVLKYEDICAAPTIFSTALKRDTTAQPPIRTDAKAERIARPDTGMHMLRSIAPTACRCYGYL